MKRQTINTVEGKEVSLSLSFLQKNKNSIDFFYPDLIIIALNDAKQILYNYISYRPRSIYESEQRLYKDNFLKGEIEQTIQLFIQNRLLDDNLFIKYFIQSYTENSKIIGNKLLKYKLIQKGISEKNIDNHLQEYYSQEYDTIIQKTVLLVKKNLYRWEHSKNWHTKKEKIFRFLYNKGFSSSVIHNTIEILYNQQEFS